MRHVSYRLTRAAQKRVPRLRQEGSRLAAGITGGVAVATAAVLWLTGVTGLEGVFGTLAMAIAAVWWPDPPPKIAEPAPPAVS